MNDFLPVANVSEFEDTAVKCFEVEDRYVVIAKIGDSFHCIDDVCTHDGGTLGDGELDGNCLVCPRHGAKFDVRNGEAVVMPATEPTVAHETKIEGKQILVRLND
ncbi:MAG: Rieske 2Fe-2S domain-containing protein [Pirellulaceae bacterium]